MTPIGSQSIRKVTNGPEARELHRSTKSMSQQFMYLLAPVAFCICATLGGCLQKSEADLIGEARNQLEKHNPKAGAIVLKSALDEYPNSLPARTLLGRSLFEVGDFVAADVELRKALQMGANPDDCVPTLARIGLERRLHKKVIEEFSERQLGSEAAQVDLNTSVAIAYTIDGQSDKADALVASILARSPNYARAVLLKARRLARPGTL